MKKSESNNFIVYDNEDTRRILKNLVAKLEQFDKTHTLFNVVVLPDFFVDRIIKVKSDRIFFKDIKRKILAGGGSLRDYCSKDIKGGNAVNVAYSLAKLGISIKLYTVSDLIGSAVLQAVFSSFGKNVELHIAKGKHGLSSVFEFTFSSDASIQLFPPTTSINPTSISSDTSSNVMVSDVGDNDNFGPELIETHEILDSLKIAQAIVFTNWASNLRGTDLMKFIFSNSSNSIHFIDPADFELRSFEFINTIKNNSCLIDILSINENEYNLIVKALGTITSAKEKTLLHSFYTSEFPDNINNLCASAKFIYNYLGVKICIHTTKGSIMVDKDGVAFVGSFTPSAINIVSGAGDSWDAGFMFGELAGFTKVEKLGFANLLAMLHVENSGGDDPTLVDVIKYLRKI